MDKQQSTSSWTVEQKQDKLRYIEKILYVVGVLTFYYSI